MISLSIWVKKLIMKKKGFRLFLVITLILLIIINLNLVFASITIEASPEKTYHLGQKIDV